MNERMAMNGGTGAPPPQNQAPAPLERPGHAPRSLSERERAQQQRTDTTGDSEGTDRSGEQDAQDEQDAEDAPLPSEQESQNQETG
jgi:hypothetical protein